MSEDPHAAGVSERTGNSIRSVLRWLLTIALLVAIGWIVARQQPDFLAEVTLRWQPLVLAAWILAFYTVLMSERFRILTHLYLGGSQSSTLFFLHSLIVSRILNGILPQAGNIYRGSHLLKRTGLPWSGYATTLVIGVILDVAAISGILVLVLVDAHLIRIDPLHHVQFEISDILAIVIVASIFCIFLISYVITRYRPTGPIEHVASGHQSKTPLWRSVCTREHLPGLMMQSLVSLALLGIVIWLILVCMGLRPSLLDATILMIAARIAQYVVITPGNLGIRELIYALLGSQLGIGIAGAVAASLLLRVINWMVLGLLLLALEVAKSLRTKPG